MQVAGAGNLEGQLRLSAQMWVQPMVEGQQASACRVSVVSYVGVSSYAQAEKLQL